MATKSLSRGLQTLRASFGPSRDPLIQCLAPQFSRSMATETNLPYSRNSEQIFASSLPTDSFTPFAQPVLTTIYQFPTMEPLRFESYPASHLHLPLRRDILHRAVIFEGDGTRQGTASSKTRFEVHGAHRKIRPQKGTGHARLGHRQAPTIKGGGKSFGPHPRDFSTDLPKKIYDLAWRTALSYRYRKGQLIICEDGMEIEHGRENFIRQIFQHNRWGNQDGRSLVVTSSPRENLFGALKEAGNEGRALTERDVDVKDLLELGRIIIEKSALDTILAEHQSDLVKKVRAAANVAV